AARGTTDELPVVGPRPRGNQAQDRVPTLVPKRSQVMIDEGERRLGVVQNDPKGAPDLLTEGGDQGVDQGLGAGQGGQPSGFGYRVARAGRDRVTGSIRHRANLAMSSMGTLTSWRGRARAAATGDPQHPV